MRLSHKMLSGMANSEDPQEQSDLGLHCLHMAFCQTLWCSIFWTFTVDVIFTRRLKSNS